MKKEIYSENTNTLLFSAFDSTKQQKTDMYRIHHHAEPELGYICEGEGKYILADETFHAKAGDLFLVRPNEQHCVPTIYTPELKSFNFYITSYYLWNVCSEYLPAGIQQLLIGDAPIVHRFHGKGEYVEQIKALCEGGGSIGRIRFLMLCLIESIASELDLPVSAAATRRDVMPAHLFDIQNVIRFISEHMNEPLTLDDLAQCTNISRSHFSAVFKQITGVTPYEYLLLQRVERAVSLLRNTDKSIADVATGCGFNNLANFNRIFKNATGMSPRNYRLSRRSGSGEIADGDE